MAEESTFGPLKQTSTSHSSFVARDLAQVLEERDKLRRERGVYWEKTQSLNKELAGIQQPRPQICTQPGVSAQQLDRIFAQFVSVRQADDSAVALLHKLQQEAVHLGHPPPSRPWTSDSFVLLPDRGHEPHHQEVEVTPQAGTGDLPNSGPKTVAPVVVKKRCLSSRQIGVVKSLQISPNSKAPVTVGLILAKDEGKEMDIGFSGSEYSATLLPSDLVTFQVLTDLTTNKKLAVNIKLSIPDTFEATQEKRQRGVIVDIQDGCCSILTENYTNLKCDLSENLSEEQLAVMCEVEFTVLMVDGVEKVVRLLKLPQGTVTASTKKSARMEVLTEEPNVPDTSNVEPVRATEVYLDVPAVPAPSRSEQSSLIHQPEEHSLPCDSAVDSNKVDGIQRVFNLLKLPEGKATFPPNRSTQVEEVSVLHISTTTSQLAQKGVTGISQEQPRVPEATTLESHQGKVLGINTMERDFPKSSTDSENKEEEVKRVLRLLELPEEMVTTSIKKATNIEDGGGQCKAEITRKEEFLDSTGASQVEPQEQEPISIELHEGTVLKVPTKDDHIPRKVLAGKDKNCHLGSLQTTVQGQDKKLNFNADDVLTKATMMVGDRVQFQITMDPEKNSMKAINVEILPETFESLNTGEQRKVGEVLGLSKSFGYIKCLQDPKLVFDLCEVMEQKPLATAELVEFSIDLDPVSGMGSQAVRIRRVKNTLKMVPPLRGETSTQTGTNKKKIAVKPTKSTTTKLNSTKVKVVAPTASKPLLGFSEPTHNAKKDIRGTHPMRSKDTHSRGNCNINQKHSRHLINRRSYSRVSRSSSRTSGFSSRSSSSTGSSSWSGSRSRSRSRSWERALRISHHRFYTNKRWRRLSGSPGRSSRARRSCSDSRERSYRGRFRRSLSRSSSSRERSRSSERSRDRRSRQRSREMRNRTYSRERRSRETRRSRDRSRNRERSRERRSMENSWERKTKKMRSKDHSRERGTKRFRERGRSREFSQDRRKSQERCRERRSQEHSREKSNGSRELSQEKDRNKTRNMDKKIQQKLKPKSVVKKAVKKQSHSREQPVSSRSRSPRSRTLSSTEAKDSHRSKNSSGSTAQEVSEDEEELARKEMELEELEALIAKKKLILAMEIKASHPELNLGDETDELAASLLPDLIDLEMWGSDQPSPLESHCMDTSQLKHVNKDRSEPEKGEGVVTCGIAPKDSSDISQRDCEKTKA